jgi:hypothetical protein
MAAGRQRTFLVGEICQTFLDTDKYLYIPNYGKYYTVDNFKKLNLKLLDLDDIFTNPGIYTWILFIIDDKPVFKAIKSYSSLELLTKHNNIFEMYKELSGREDISVENILYAGEANTRGGRHFRYNFLSGTYMLERMKDIPLIDLYRVSVIPFEKKMREIEMKEGFRMTFSPEIKTYIPDKIGLLEYNNILKPLDIEAYLFDSKEKCNEWKVRKLGMLKSKYESMLRRNIRQLELGNKYRKEKLSDNEILLEAEKKLVTEKETIIGMEKEEQDLREGKIPGVEKIDYNNTYQTAGKKARRRRYKTRKNSKARKARNNKKKHKTRKMKK